MEAHLHLCDYAQTTGDNKLTMVGVGWNITDPGPSAMGIGLVFNVPWSSADQRHDVLLEFLDEDGHAVTAPDGSLAPVVTSVMEVGRPEGLPVGAPLPSVMALNFNGFPLAPGTRYQWKLTIDGETQESWSASFMTRETPLGRPADPD